MWTDLTSQTPARGSVEREGALRVAAHRQSHGRILSVQRLDQRVGERLSFVEEMRAKHAETRGRIRIGDDLIGEGQGVA